MSNLPDDIAELAAQALHQAEDMEIRWQPLVMPDKGPLFTAILDKCGSYVLGMISGDRMTSPEEVLRVRLARERWDRAVKTREPVLAQFALVVDEVLASMFDSGDPDKFDAACLLSDELHVRMINK